jgi:hypothetical protein
VSIDGAGVNGVNSLPLSEFRSTFPVLKNPTNVHKAERPAPGTAQEAAAYEREHRWILT